MNGRIALAQIRGARGILDWSLLDLARASGLSLSTVKRMERETLQPVSDSSFAAVQAAFESAGCVSWRMRAKASGCGCRPAEISPARLHKRSTTARS